MQVYISTRSRNSKKIIIIIIIIIEYTMVQIGEGLCSIARETYGLDMVYTYITASNERTDGNSMGLTT